MKTVILGIYALHLWYFYALVEAGRQLRKMDHSGPDLMQMLDLVALATVADVAPLIGVNRAFVRQGLAHYGAAQTPWHNGPCRLAQT